MINYIKGDLFSHTANSPENYNVLIHACNCKGSWGAGVAAMFRKLFPSTYKKHQAHCSNVSNSADLLGTCQIIESDPNDELGRKTLVTCLFTSDKYGHKKDTPEDIVKYTQLAMQDMVQQLQQYANNLDTKDGRIVVCMPKINAGLFGVPWELTEAVLQQFTQLEINVYVL